MRYVLIFVLCFLLSVGGIAVAAYFQSPANGGRGGALAVGIAFFMLFLRRDYGAVAYELRTKKIPQLQRRIEKLERHGTPAPDDTTTVGVTELAREIKGILDFITINAEGQKIQNFAMAIASCVGTVAWGFGDIASGWLMHHLH